MIDASDDLKGSFTDTGFEILARSVWTKNSSSSTVIKGEIESVAGNKTLISIRIWPAYSFLYLDIVGASVFYAVAMQCNDEMIACAVLIAGAVCLCLFSYGYALQSKALTRATFEDALAVKPITPQT